MRTIAIIMVVAVHCIPEGQSDAAHVYAAFMKALLFPCNAVFFLLSGMFNLKSTYLDKLPHYYYRKIRNKWLRTSGITAGIPVAAPLHHMDERLMHPEDRGTRWRRVMQAD